MRTKRVSCPMRWGLVFCKVSVCLWLSFSIRSIRSQKFGQESKDSEGYLYSEAPNFFVIIITALIALSCKHNLTNPPEEPLFSTTLTGKVVLENQTEYSNTLVYIDSLNRGVSTDSSGNYTLIFNEADSVYSGVFKVLYFLYDYDVDSAKIVLDKVYSDRNHLTVESRSGG